MEKTDIDRLHEQAEELDKETLALMERIEEAKTRIHNWAFEVELNNKKVDRLYERMKSLCA